MTSRACRRCGVVQPIEQFNLRGNGERRLDCQVCMKEKRLKRRANRPTKRREVKTAMDMGAGEHNVYVYRPGERRAWEMLDISKLDTIYWRNRLKGE